MVMHILLQKNTAHLEAPKLAYTKGTHLMALRPNPSYGAPEILPWVRGGPRIMAWPDLTYEVRPDRLDHTCGPTPHWIRPCGHCLKQFQLTKKLRQII